MELPDPGTSATRVDLREAVAPRSEAATSAEPSGALAELFRPDVDGPELDRHRAAQAEAFTGRRARRHANLTPPAPAPRPGFVARALAFGSKGLLMVALVWGLFFNFSEVRGSSMRPGIRDGDRILVDHVSYMFTSVGHGDIVVLRYPLDPSVDYVKRVIGVPGDHVEIFRGQVWVNGLQLEEPYVDAANLDPWAFVDTVVESEHYFVLGDNRIRSSDSRNFGQVAAPYLRGKVRARLWPLERAGLIR